MWFLTQLVLQVHLPVILVVSMALFVHVLVARSWEMSGKVQKEARATQLN